MVCVMAVVDASNTIRVVNTERGGAACELTFHNRTMQCALGKGGVVDGPEKREGDGCTPAGTFPLRRAFYRADRVPKPATHLSWINATKVGRSISQFFVDFWSGNAC